LPQDFITTTTGEIGMLIGVPKAFKNHAYRAAVVPASVQEPTSRGHVLLMQTQAGASIGFSDEDYRTAGATIAANAELVRAEALKNTTLPHTVALADLGGQKALRRDPHLASGLNIHAGQVACPEVAEALGYPRVPMPLNG
jgi:alanine dehydrogenase